MKKKILIIMKWIIFCSIVLGILVKISPYYANRKGADYNYQTFQMMEENPDILIVGTSLTEYAISPNELYKDYGFTSYNLSAHSQMLDTMYYVLDTALKYKEPKLIIVSTDYINELTSKSTLNDEIISIRDLNAGLGNQLKYLYSHFGTKTMEYIKFYLPVFQFHSQLLDGTLNIDKMKRNNYLKKLYQKGYSYLDGIKEIEIAKNEEELELNPEAVARTKEMIQKCNERGIQIVFVTLPNIEPYYYDESIKVNFSDCGYLNFYDLAEEIGLDGKTDFLDNHHMTYSGASKVTKYIGQYLEDNYDLTDHRDLNENNLWDITLPVLDKMPYWEYDDGVWEEALKQAGYSKY